MAGNPLVANFAKNIGVRITWIDWMLAALVPGVISLLLMPLIVYKIYPPGIKKIILVGGGRKSVGNPWFVIRHNPNEFVASEPAGWSPFLLGFDRFPVPLRAGFERLLHWKSRV